MANNTGSSQDSFSSYEEVLEYKITDCNDSEDEDSLSTLVVEEESRRDADRNMQRTASYDAAFAETGFGLWQIILLVQCGWANASDAVEIMCVSFIIPAIRDGMNISNRDLSGLSISVFLGMMVGGYLWGVLADSIGRRKVIMMSLTVNAVFAIASAFAKSYPAILAFRLLSGIGVGGSLPVCFSYFTEFQPANRRGSMISALATCWMAGNLLVAGIAWVVMGNAERSSRIAPYHDSWRLFIIVCSIPSLSSAFFFYKMPESPKFLYNAGEYQKCLKVLRKMFYWNQYLKKRTRFFTIDEIEPKVSDIYCQSENESLLPLQQIVFRPQRRQSFSTILSSTLQRSNQIMAAFWGQIMEIFSVRKKRFFTSTALSVINLTLAFGSYGLIMWMPTLMEKTEKFGHSPCRGNFTGHSLDNKTDNPNDVYFDIFIGAAAQLPANILTILLMDYIGGRIFLIGSMFASGVSVLFFGLLNTKMQILVMSAIFNAVSTIAWNGLDVVSMEMFTTDVRSSALGFFTGLVRLGSISSNLLFGVFMDANCFVPICVVAIAFMIGGLFSFFLPNTRQISLD